MSKHLNADASRGKVNTTPPTLGNRRLISIMVAACLPGIASANVAGTVDFSNGTAMVVYDNGNRESLSKGMQLKEGDTVRTGTSGLAQIRFTDGAYVSIQNNTTFKIDEYAYDGKPGGTSNNNKGFFSLIKGGFRAITGFLGAKNYQVKTPVATIGIRGTEYYAEYGRSLTFNVADGAIQVCNTGGCQFFRESEFGNIKDNASVIQRLNDSGLDVVVSEANDKTVATVEGDDEFIFRITEEVTNDGDLAILGGSDPQCANRNCTAAFAWVDEMGTLSLQSVSMINAEFSNGVLIGHDGDAGNATDSVGNAIAQPAGSTPDLAWGRWVGGPTAAGFTDVHYVIGTPTPNINSLTGTAQLAVSGWTTPTVENAALGAFMRVEGNLAADFDNLQLDMDLDVKFVNADYHLHTTGPIAINDDATFSDNALSVTGGIPGMSGPSCDFTGCMASLAGFFAGTNANSAGLSYYVKDTANGNIHGAAVFGGDIENTGTVIPD